MHLSLSDKVIFRDVMSGNYSSRVVGDNKRIRMCPKPSKHDFMISLLVIGVNFVYFKIMTFFNWFLPLLETNIFFGIVLL